MNKPKCSKCESTEVYMRIKSKERVCRKCGYIEKINGGVENGKNNKN